MGAERQTNIQTYIHTFWKIILVNQAHAYSQLLAGCGRMPGLKNQAPDIDHNYA